MRYTLQQVKQAQAKKEGFVDNIVADLVYRKLSRYLTWLLSSTPVTPVMIVWLGFLLGCAGVGFFTTGQYVLMLVGMLLIHIGNVFDCVDGELARLTGQISKYGGWLDLTFDAALEFFILAGLMWALRERMSIDNLLLVGLLSLLATSMMYFSIAWSALVFDDAVNENERLKKAGGGPLALLRRIHPMIFSYSGDVRKAILTIFLVFDEPFWFLAFNAVVGNVYWMIRIWVYRKR